MEQEKMMPKEEDVENKTGEDNGDNLETPQTAKEWEEKFKKAHGDDAWREQK